MSEWVKRINIAIETIKKEDYSEMDRLQKYFAIRKLLNTLGVSVQGWQQWANSETFGKFDDKKLEEICNKLRGFILTFLQYDAEITEPVETNQTKKQTNKNKKKIATYVA